MTIKVFTQAELLKLSKKEAEARKRLEVSGAGMNATAQFNAETISAMWARVLSRLAADGLGHVRANDLRP